MNLTKFQHACAVVELDGQALVIDPGSFSDDFVMTDNIVAVVLTHQHPDHVSAKLLDDIVRRYPKVVIFTTADHDLTHNHVVARPDDAHTVGAFRLDFFGGKHAAIDESIPQIDNIGVFINDLLCYPGDSFASPDRPIDTLLLPIAAPWMKISDALDYIRSEHPRIIVPTHDAILSEAGQGVADNLVARTAGDLGLAFHRLPSGGTLDISPKAANQ